MAINLGALSDASTKVTALSNLILVSPQKTVGYQPQNAPSWKRDTAALPKALVFNYEGEQSVALESDITDHYVENNTAVQDQIALRPVIIATQGFVGELNDIPPAALLPLKEAAEKLTPISAYAPGLSVTAQLAYANAFQAYQIAALALNSAVETWSSINGGPAETVINGSTQTNADGSISGGASNQTKQQIYFQQFFAYWKRRTLFTVQTPWAIFQDMAIQSIRSVQDANTRMVSTFEVTFKQMRFAATQVVESQLYDNNNMQGRAYEQGSTEVDLGISTLETSPSSFSELIA